MLEIIYSSSVVHTNFTFANGEKHIRVDKPLYGKNYNHTLYVSAKALSVGYSFSLNVDAASKSASDE